MQIDDTKANTPLEFYWKVLSFFLPGFITLILRVPLESQGYIRKYRESVHYARYGLVFYVSMAVLAGALIR